MIMKKDFLLSGNSYSFDNYAETLEKDVRLKAGFVCCTSGNVFRIYFDGGYVFTSKHFSSLVRKQRQLFKKYNLKFRSL